jgi:hypothetical protein
MQLRECIEDRLPGLCGSRCIYRGLHNEGISLLHMKGVEGEYMAVMGVRERTSSCLALLVGEVLLYV